MSIDKLPSQLAVAAIVGLISAIACLWFSPLWTLIALTGLVFGYAALKRPEIALLAILVCTSTIIFESELPLIPIGVGSLHISDFLLLGSLGLVAVRWLVEPDFKIVHTPLDWPLLAFCGLALLSTAIAILSSSVGFNQGLREFRVVCYYLTFFIVTNLVREDRQLRFLVRGILLLATIVAMAMLAQFLFGTSLRLFPGRIETLATQGVRYSDVIRVLPPGQSLVVVALVVSVVLVVVGESRTLALNRFLQTAMLALGVTLTFNRSFWVAVGLTLILLVFLVRGRERQKMVALAVGILVLGAIVLAPILTGPPSPARSLVTASSERFATLFSSDTLTEASFQYRSLEYEYAIPQVLSHPLLGLGLGSRYRPWDRRLDPSITESRGYYIHNGHLWLILKTGFLGYIGLFSLSIIFLFRGFRSWRRVIDPSRRAILLSFVLAYVGVLMAALVNPLFAQWYWTPLLGIMFGTNEVILRESQGDLKD